MCRIMDGLEKEFVSVKKSVAKFLSAQKKSRDLQNDAGKNASAHDGNNWSSIVKSFLTTP